MATTPPRRARSLCGRSSPSGRAGVDRPLQHAGAAVEVEISGVGPAADPDADDDAEDRDERGEVGGGEEDGGRHQADRAQPAAAGQAVAGTAPSGQPGAEADEDAAGEQHADHGGWVAGDDVAEALAHVVAELEAASPDRRDPTTGE